MKRWSAAAIALSLSLGAHWLGFGVAGAPEATQIAGGGSPEIAMLGDSFADLVAGSIVSTPPDAAQTVDPDNPIEPVAVEGQAERAQDFETAEVIQPNDLADAAAAEPAETPTPTALDVRQDQPDTVEPTSVINALRPVGAVQVSDPTDATHIAEIGVAAPLAPRRVEEAAVDPGVTAVSAPSEVGASASPDLQTIAAVSPPEAQTPDASTQRPQPRPDTLGQAPEPQPAPQPARQPQPAPQPAPQAQAGNADENAQRGSAQGQQTGEAAAQGNPAPQPQQQTGNSAASNYPGVVMRAIQRSRERTSERGVATVRFSIAPGGALAGLEIARSSGNPTLDQIALRTVQRAAPFPPPPLGAMTAFNVEIAGRN